MKNLIAVFKALSDRNRLRIFAALLAYDELCACQVTELLKVAGATASRHMAIMVQAGLIKNRKQGRWVYYSLNKSGDVQSPVPEWVESKLKYSDEIKKDLKALKKIMTIPPEDLCRQQRGEACCPRD
ncbi:MAG: winged helix-turn-helix transcriptional regulator [Deltaproteobacteria bacterium]|nr:winged helix-turn-helix transcriptional regulator [Deltaproteobacteria bacterium]